MREIKFRAWNIKRNKFANPKWFGIDLSGNLLNENGGDDNSFNFITALQEVKNQYILMQHTGLKDKNGKEIYEGDIIKEQGPRTNGLPGAAFLREIVFYEGKFMGKDIGIDDPELYQNISHSSYNEVLGNIYENPELLK